VIIWPMPASKQKLMKPGGRKTAQEALKEQIRGRYRFAERLRSP
jgi:hypothetical protein